MTTLPTNIGSGSTGHWSHTNTLHTAHNKGHFFLVGQEGTLAVAAGALHVPVPFACTLVGAHMRVQTAPTGASLIVDINKGVSGGGAPTTIYTTQANRPTITGATFSSGSIVTPDVTAMAQFDYLVFDIDQIGSTIAGANLIIVVEYVTA